MVYAFSLSSTKDEEEYLQLGKLDRLEEMRIGERRVKNAPGEEGRGKEGEKRNMKDERLNTLSEKETDHK